MGNQTTNSDCNKEAIEAHKSYNKIIQLFEQIGSFIYK